MAWKLVYTDTNQPIAAGDIVRVNGLKCNVVTWHKQPNVVDANGNGGDDPCVQVRRVARLTPTERWLRPSSIRAKWVEEPDEDACENGKQRGRKGRSNGQP